MKSKKLSGTDSLFLAMETGNVHGHVGGLMILDTSEAPGVGFETVQKTIEERLHLAGPEFSSRVQEAPLGMTRPYLVTDPTFSIDRHVRRIAVPAPGGMREVADLCGLLFERKLDRNHPLWEAWYIEGLEDGRVGLFIKTHHALMDGSKGVDLSTILCDIEPNPSAPLFPARPMSAQWRNQAPSNVDQILEAVNDLVGLPGRVVEYGFQALRRAADTLPHLVENGTQGVPLPVPALPFNQKLGAERRFAFTSIPLQEAKAAKDKMGVKLNDLVVAICGDAMRRWADRSGRRLEGSLAVSCPVSTRDDADRETANKIANMTVSCATDIADPIERVREVHRRSNAAKEVTRRVRRTPIASLGDVFPPALVQLGVKLGGDLAQWSGTATTNAVVSNVAGPPMPLYLAGTRVCAVYPISLLAPTQGLNFTAVSFTGRLDIGLTADPETLPAPWEMIECVEESWSELRRALATPRSLASREARRRPEWQGPAVRSIAAA